MKWFVKQVEEMAEINAKEGWSISDPDGVLVKGKSSAMMINALTVYLAGGFYIDSYTRSFSDGTLRIYIDKEN